MEELTKYTATNPNFSMTPNEMWKTINLNTDIGIEGYEIHKKYFDYLKSKEYKKRWDKNTANKIKCAWPPQNLKDADGNIKWPKRKNYLDDVI